MPKREWKRENILLRMALMAPTGGGKTLGALAIAATIFDGKLPIVGIDTEHERMKLYADMVELADYRVLESDYSPEKYVEELDAVEAEYSGGVCIIDSATHEWSGANGVLQIVDKGAGGNWKEGTPRHNKFTERIASMQMHMIVCVRAKMKWDYTTDTSGKRKQTLLGMGPDQRESFMYGFDVIADIDHETHLATFANRCRPLLGQSFNLVPDLDDLRAKNEVAEIITAWLSEGDVPTPPEAAADSEVERLVELLTAEGKSPEKIEEVFKKRRQMSRGVLPPEWVADKIALAETRRQAMIDAMQKPLVNT